MKKIFGGLILIFCLIQISLVVVCAGESTQKCTYTEKYNYVTDIEELLELGEVQPLSNETGQISTTITEDGDLLVRQLIKREYYDDGSYCEQYVENGIDLFEYLNTTRTIEKKSYSQTWRKYDVAATIVAYYTRYFNQAGVENGIVVQRLDFKYTGGSAYSVVQAQMYSHGIYNAVSAEPIERYKTIDHPKASVVYILYTDDVRVYNSSYACSFNVGTIVSLSNGTVSGDYDLMILLEQLEAQW